MRWLVVSPYLPHSRIGHGGGTCVFDLCRALAGRHDVELLCFERADESGLQREVEDAGVTVHTVPFRSEQDRGLSRLALYADRLRCQLQSRMTRTPFMAVKYRRERMRAALRSRIRTFQPDVVQVEYGFMAGYAECARDLVRDSTRSRGAEPARGDLPRPVVLLNTHELVTLARLRRLATERSWWRLLALRRAVEASAGYESRFHRWADEVLCVTDQDRTMLHALCAAPNLRTVPLGSDVDALPVATPPSKPPPTLLFVGSFGHPPNVDAAHFLVAEVLPLVWQRRPDVEADIVGANPPRAIAEIAASTSGRVHVRGFVESLDESFDRASLFVAPLREGGGIKIKILEAMARGMPVVTSPVGAEGIDEAGHACRIGSSAPDLAAIVLRLLAEDEVRDELRHAARRHIEAKFGWGSITETLERSAREVAMR